jgi:hypothetical protein
MLENMSVGTATVRRRVRRRAPWARLPTEPYARRVERLRRAFQRELGRKLTLIEKTAVFKAAVLTAKAEVAALDPAADVGELTKLVNIADRAVRRLGFRSIVAERPARSASRVLALRRQRWEEAAAAKGTHASDLKAQEASPEQNPTEPLDAQAAAE